MNRELQTWFDSKRHTEAEYHERCESAHPSHEYLHSSGGQPRFWTAWCRICDREGRNKEMTCLAHPDMSPEHLAKARELAVAEEMERAKRYRSRQKLPRCVCPDCGTEHIKRNASAA